MPKQFPASRSRAEQYWLRPLLFVDAFESQIVAVIKENTLLTHPTINDMVNHPPGALRAVRGILIDYQKHPNSQELDLSGSVEKWVTVRES